MAHFSVMFPSSILLLSARFVRACLHRFFVNVIEKIRAFIVLHLKYNIYRPFCCSLKLASL